MQFGGFGDGVECLGWRGGRLVKVVRTGVAMKYIRDYMPAGVITGLRALLSRRNQPCDSGNRPWPESPPSDLDAPSPRPAIGAACAVRWSSRGTRWHDALD